MFIIAQSGEREYKIGIIKKLPPITVINRKLVLLQLLKPCTQTFFKTYVTLSNFSLKNFHLGNEHY